MTFKPKLINYHLLHENRAEELLFEEKVFIQNVANFVLRNVWKEINKLTQKQCLSWQSIKLSKKVKFALEKKDLLVLTCPDHLMYICEYVYDRAYKNFTANNILVNQNRLTFSINGQTQEASLNEKEKIKQLFEGWFKYFVLESLIFFRHIELRQTWMSKYQEGIKELFNWRDRKLKIRDMEEKLPELKGLFE